MDWTGADSQEAKGVTGLNWLLEHSLPQEKEDKQEKGNNRDSYCVASLPGEVSTESEAHR